MQELILSLYHQSLDGSIDLDHYILKFLLKGRYYERLSSRKYQFESLQFNNQCEGSQDYSSNNQWLR